MAVGDELIVHTHAPLNAEPPPDRLRAAFITPQPLFYIRSHGDIPNLDTGAWRLSVTGLVKRTLDLELRDLQGLPVRQVIATMQCAGNRRADMLRVRPVSGDPWAAGAIGNAIWTGVKLADVLRLAGARTDEGLHVAFGCADACEMDGRRFRYGASIPMGKARADEVLLAWAMNGEALRPEHGAPLRAVVPGYAGVRNAKWLLSIRVQDAPSDNPIQAEDYKLFPPDATKETADPARGLTINAMPVNSAICEPAAHATLPAGPTRLRGYATASDRHVARVDVSADGGRHWQQAVLEDTPRALASDGRPPWAWVFWHADLDLEPGEHELAVRAFDDAGQTQPARPDDTWNHKGYLSAAWHRVSVVVA